MGGYFYTSSFVGTSRAYIFLYLKPFMLLSLFLGYNLSRNVD